MSLKSFLRKRFPLAYFTIICIAPGHIALYANVTQTLAISRCNGLLIRLLNHYVHPLDLLSAKTTRALVTRCDNSLHTFQGQVRSGKARSGQVRSGPVRYGD